MSSPAPPRKQAEEPRSRWWSYVRQGRIVCGPDGHHIPNTFHVTEAGFVRCQHHVRHGAQWHDCGRWVFLYAIRGGGVVVAEVSLDEKRAMERLTTPAEMLEYLGAFREA